MAPLLAKHRNAIFMNEALFPASTALDAARQPSASTPEQARVLDRYHTIFVRAGARLEPEAKARLAADHRAPREPRHAVLAERARRREGLSRSFSTARRISPGCRPSCARPRPARRRSAALPASTSSRSSRSSIEPFLQFSTRRDLREQAFKAWASARRQRRRHRQQGDHRRDGGACAPSGRGSSATRPSPISSSPTRWRRRPAAVLELLRRGLGAGARARRARARRPAGAGAGARRQHRHRAVGLALLRRTGAQGAPRPRRGDAQAVLPARPHHRGRLRHGAAAVRPELRGDRSDVPRYHPDVRVWEVTDARRRALSACSSATISPGPRSAAAPG